MKKEKKFNLLIALNESNEENFNNKKGIFNMPCYETLDGRVAAFGVNNIYYYRDLESLDSPVSKETKWWEPEEERFLGHYECNKTPISTAREVLNFFGVNQRSDIGTGFPISELKYAPKEFLFYLKGLADWGLKPSNCEDWFNRRMKEVKNAFLEGKSYSELVGFRNIPEWVEDSLKGVNSYRNAKIFKSFLNRNKADWKWQRKSLKFWYEMYHQIKERGMHRELILAYNSIRELNTSFGHTWAAAMLSGAGTPECAETSSTEANGKVFSISINGVNLYSGLGRIKSIFLEENEFHIALFNNAIYGKNILEKTKIFFLWEKDSEFRFHFEGASLKEAYEKWRHRELTEVEVIVRDGVSFENVDKMGFCLSGSKSFLQRRAPFIFSLVKDYESEKNAWETVPQEIMKLVFYPTPEFAREIMNRY